MWSLGEVLVMTTVAVKLSNLLHAFLPPNISCRIVKNMQEGIFLIVSMKAESVVLYKHLQPEDKDLYDEWKKKKGEIYFKNTAVYCTFPYQAASV